MQAGEAKVQAPKAEIQAPEAEIQAPGAEIQAPEAEIQAPEAEIQAPEAEIQAPEAEIQAMIDRETSAWDTRDAEALVDLFHPDMVWPWPPDAYSHDPATWLFPWGRYDRERWRADWQSLFDTHTLVHNRRTTIKITLSAEGDGALAVVDVDTLWRDQDGRDSHWLGRAGKGYTKVDGEWKLIMHTGLLQYTGGVVPSSG